jgi:hypothetical protein
MIGSNHKEYNIEEFVNNSIIFILFPDILLLFEKFIKNTLL